MKDPRNLGKTINNNNQTSIPKNNSGMKDPRIIANSNMLNPQKVLDSITKGQQFKVNVPQKNTNVYGIDLSNIKPDSVSAGDAVNQEEQQRILNDTRDYNVVKGALNTAGKGVMVGTANTIDATYAVGTKAFGPDATTINEENLLRKGTMNDKNADFIKGLMNLGLRTFPPYQFLKSMTGFNQNTRDSWNELNKLYEKNSDNKQLERVYNELKSGTYQGTEEDLKRELSEIQTQIANKFKLEHTDDERIRFQEQLEENQSKYGNGLTNAFLTGTGVVGQMVPTVLASTINPTLGTTAIGLNAGGGAYSQALDEGAQFNEAYNYGVLSGVAEATIEQFGGDKVNKALGIKTKGPANKILTGLNKINNKYVRGGLKIGKEVVEEGLEEVATTFIDPALQKITYNPNANYNNIWQEMGNSFIESIIPTLLMGGIGTARQKVTLFVEGSTQKINSNTNLTPEQKAEAISQVQQTAQEVNDKINKIENNTQNNANIAQTSPNNEQISQNNVQNAQNFEKTGQNFVYHGTLANVKGEDLIASDFGDLGEGLYFAREKEIAEQFSDIGFRNNNLERMSDGRYIDINTGKIIEAGTPHLIEASIDNLKIKQMEPAEWNKAIESLRNQKTNALPINYETVAQEQFKQQGYDGIELINAGNNNQVVIFPNSIKKIQYNKSNVESVVRNDVESVNPYNGYTNKEIENIEGGKIKVARGNSDIISFVQTARKMANNLKLYMSKVKKSTADIIKNKFNIDVEGYNISLKNDDVRKIYKDHGKAETELPRGQLPITEEDFTFIPMIINEPDTIDVRGTSKEGKPAIVFEKNINGNRVVVTYVSDKHKNLELQTMYKFKNDKKIDSSTALYENQTPRLNTSEMDSSTNLITNIIPNSQDYVNNQNILPSTEQLQAQDKKQTEEAYNTLNMKKPKLEDIAELTEEQAQLPTMTYKQRADKNTPYRRKFWDNVETSKIVSDKVKEQVNMTNYERKHNSDVLETMKERLDTEPMKVAQEWFRKDIKKATEQDVALGAILLERFQQEGRFEEAVDVVEKLGDMGTEAGRTVQMYSIFQRLTPEGMMIYQQRKLSSALETLTQKQTGKWVEQNKDKFKLTEDDATFITAKVQEAQNAPTERQKQIALAEIEKRINDKLPPEAGQSVKAFRRIAMLFNPKTQFRNILGNVTVMPLNYVTDLVATGIDKAIAKKTGVRTTALPNIKTIARGTKKGWNETWNDYKRGIRTTPTGSKYEIQNNVKSFNENTNSKIKNAINKKLNGIDRLLSSVMEAGDRPFYEASYQNALEGQMKANGVTEPTQEMIDIASNVALSQTWQDNNNYTQAVLGIRSAFNKININGFGLGDLIIPFAKTPANLTKAMVDYSPAGLIPSIINYNDMKKAISRGDMTATQQKKFVTSVGKAVAGTILYTIAGALAKGGGITGSSDEDKDVANFEKNVLGIQPYSIKIGDKTFTYNWAQPLATPFAIMSDTYKMSEEGAKWDEILVNAFKVAGDQLVANSFLQGIQELLSSEYGNESAMDNLVGAIMDLPTQFTPTLLGQIATQFDSTKRQTFENGDTVGTTVNEFKNKIPGVRNTLAPQVNTFGEEIQNYGGDNNPFNVFLNPGNISSTNATDTQKELYALYEVTKDKTIFPRQAPYSVSGGGEKFTLSSQDRADYQKTSGQYVTEQLDALFDSKFYKSLDNSKKVDVVAKIVGDADTTAKDKWIDTEATERLADLKNELNNSGIPLLDYYNAWIAQKDIEGKKNTFTGKTKSGTKKQARLKAINEAVGDNLSIWQVNKLYDLLN